MSDELRIVMGGLKDDIWISDNAFRNAGGTSIGVTMWGLGETLTRVSTSGEIIPWLAESVSNVDALTWRLKLRSNAAFWDGTPVSAEAVARSFAQSLQVQKDVGLLLSPDTRARVVDDWTLDFITPEPNGQLPSALAHPQLIVQTADGACLTGPYRPVEYQADRVLRLEQSAGHWAGPPSVGCVCISVMPDLSAQVAALQAGEADLIYAYPPEAIADLDQFENGYAVISWSSMRLHTLQLNCTRPPFDDMAVRNAMSLGIDRDRLIRDVLRGHGAAACGLVPPWSAEAGGACAGVDLERAEQLLDGAGWTMGADGVRHKGEHRLAFTLYTPTGPVLAMRALARQIAEQLAPLGYAISPQEVPALSGAVKDGTYTAALRTGYSQLTGDAYFWLKLWLSRDGRANPGPSYVNPNLDSLLEEYRCETQPLRRQAYWRQIDALLATEVPHVFLLFVPLILVGRPSMLRNLVGDPNNEYFIGQGGITHG
jgi:peptide/nickel transport system substrate-binding protein